MAQSRAALFLILLSGVLLTSEAFAQTRLTYCQPTDPFIDLRTTFKLDNTNDTGGIMGFAERFDLPPGAYFLDSVDFVVDSAGADSNAVDMVPVMTSQTKDGPEMLPDFSNPSAIERFNPSSIAVNPGSRTAISCGKVRVETSFFIFLVCNVGQNLYRAREHTSSVAFDTARGIFVFFPKLALTPVGALIDGNLVPTGVNVDMDIGITYENADGVQVHLSASSTTPIAFPNPATVGSSVHFNSSNKIISIKILDEAGRMVCTQSGRGGASISDISTQGFSAGVYNAIFYDSKGSESTVRFVVQ